MAKILGLVLLSCCTESAHAHNDSDINSSKWLSLDPFNGVEVVVYEADDAGFLSLSSPFGKCSNGLKVTLQPGTTYGYQIDKEGIFDLDVSNNTLRFFRSDYKPSKHAPPGASILVSMPATALTSLVASLGNGVEISPGFDLENLRIDVSSEARLFASSLCARSFDEVHITSNAAVNFIVPSSCGNVSFDKMEVTNGAALGVDLELLVNAAGEIVSGGTINGGTWLVESGARASISAGAGIVSNLEVSGGSGFYSKGIDVETFTGKDGAQYAVDDGSIYTQDTFGGASRVEFEVQARDITPANLGPWSVVGCSYDVNDDYTIPWWLTLIAVLGAGLVIAGGIGAIIYLTSRRRPARRTIVEVRLHSQPEGAASMV